MADKTPERVRLQAAFRVLIAFWWRLPVRTRRAAKTPNSQTRRGASQPEGFAGAGIRHRTQPHTARRIQRQGVSDTTTSDERVQWWREGRSPFWSYPLKWVVVQGFIFVLLVPMVWRAMRPERVSRD